MIVELLFGHCGFTQKRGVGEESLPDTILFGHMFG